MFVFFFSILFKFLFKTSYKLLEIYQKRRIFNFFFIKTKNTSNKIKFIF